MLRGQVGKMKKAKHVRHMGLAEQAKHYFRRAATQTSFVILVLLMLTLLDGVASVPYNASSTLKNKRMNYDSGEVFASLDNSTQNTIKANLPWTEHETGEELDESNPNFNERRWKLDWGVDMILRYEKGYAYCTSYILLPAENSWPVAVRGLLYAFCLFYLFLGVAIISDIFMGSIEEITAERQKIVLQTSDDGTKEEKSITYTVWNDTVANLTLLALGSSAPEILLAVVETCTTLDKMPGELGPSTIVGSAAFNLLCIVGICMVAVDEVKKIKEFGVFLITATWSLWAYIWMIIVLQVSSPDVVEIWEGVVTLSFFPLLVLTAYGQDQNWGRGKDDDSDDEGAGKDAEMDAVDKDGVPQPQPDNTNPPAVMPSDGKRRSTVTRILDAQLHGCTQDEVLEIINAAKANHGKVTEETIKEELEKTKPRKRLNSGHYRMSAIRSMIMKQNDVRRISNSSKASSSHSSHKRVVPVGTEPYPECGVAEFSSPAYSVMEAEGEVYLRICRRGGHQGILRVRYTACDLTAIDGMHYRGTSGEVTFADGEVLDKEIRVEIIDNDLPNPDMLFTVKLETVEGSDAAASHLGASKMAVVTIIDDDLPGEVRFKTTFLSVPENKGVARVEVVREGGVTGTLLVGYRTMDGVGRNAASAPRDYHAAAGTLRFAHGEQIKHIDVPIVDRSLVDREDHFFVALSNMEGKHGGKIGLIPRVRVVITPDHHFVDLVQDVLSKVREDEGKQNAWLDQIRESMEIGEDENGDRPSMLEYFMHFLTFFWKVFFAFTPPPSMAGGWPCFVVSLFCIGLLTAMVAEIAGLAGCVIGLKDQVTAITFVALGTSLPDTFASKQAIEEEEYADAAVGNVTGSNSVNVFLGLGLPWVIASIYYNAKGECYIVPSGTLSFSVTVFTILAAVCIMCLLALRVVQGGEIGGKYRYFFAALFCFMWVLYILISALNAYGHLPQFPGTENRCPCDCKNRGILRWAAEPADVEGSCIAAGCAVP